MKKSIVIFISIIIVAFLGHYYYNHYDLFIDVDKYNEDLKNANSKSIEEQNLIISNYVNDYGEIVANPSVDDAVLYWYMKKVRQNVIVTTLTIDSILAIFFIISIISYYRKKTTKKDGYNNIEAVGNGTNIVKQEIIDDIQSSVQPIEPEFPSLFEELKERCNPQNYMDPYNFRKIKIANELYSLVLLCHDSDEEKLKSLRKRASEELSIKFSTISLFNQLCCCCNPKKFMDPYDAIQIDVANDLYYKIKKAADDIATLENIQKEALERNIWEK